MSLELLSKTTHARLEQAFQNGTGLQLNGAEVCILYLQQARLADLERFGKARDWPAITAYCPNDNPRRDSADTATPARRQS